MSTTAVPSLYQQRIAEHVEGIDPRHVEAWMRIEHGTLDHLDEFHFIREASIGAECAEAAGRDESEALAVSFGL